ncbi:hypothetical protein HDEF_2054 [Candidatus Hamiltonella defensa 5AT (Acyrthosiphon pisum)]|uniref:Uncharacterized protein n=1 Tax=Hamiltonella defensa subsp. Acyrthosiphon pisum (strain 5AT) TaxID=572265 RepID=C4K6K7_HAMD5|nr:hypothetical protein HDEF_1586 [Candidatus Hamiltonella defensa 5AT (Acyrthosiphon pisum)]ACQ68622.1 hypothetical protein HDEF_2054 [Candidatus Hamiltonella defensa 5AT (Acyrthosiphon pisum)]
MTATLLTRRERVFLCRHSCFISMVDWIGQP